MSKTGQTFCIEVPNTGSTITCGSGAVEGISMTSGGDHFFHAGAELILEAKSDMRMASDGVLGAASMGGVLIGTPQTIQHSAGGGIQLYAGAGVTPSTGSPYGPGKGFQASEAPKVNAGGFAESMNKLNDVAKLGSDVTGAVTDWKKAKRGYDRMKAAYDLAKGGWDATKNVLGAKSTTADQYFGGAGAIMAFAEGGEALVKGDLAGAAGTLIGKGVVPFTGLVTGADAGKKQAAIEADYGEKLAAAKAAAAATGENGAAGGSIGAPADGPRIHEVAPANIDRECGAHMTAKVGGNKTAVVDGKIEYKAGSSIAMKAFSKVETSSMAFTVFASVSAGIKGLASAKVESLGSATLEGRGKFKVATNGAGTVDAKGMLTLKAGGKMDVTSGATMIVRAGGPLAIQVSSVGVTGKGRVSLTAPDVQLKGKTEVFKDLKVRGNVSADKKVTVTGKITGKSGAKIGGTVQLG